MYLYAWKAGLKTTYYLRSRPATRIQQATVAVLAAGASVALAASAPDAEVLVCSIEIPRPARPASSEGDGR